MFLQELQYFVTVAEQLSFTGAAKQLFITQSGLSKHIMKMESELGIRLFKRGARPLELTAAGEEFFTLSRQFLYGCNALRMSDEPENNPVAGSVSIGVSAHYGHYGHKYMSACMDLFREELSNMNLEIVTDSPHELAKRFMSCELDLLITGRSTLHTLPPSPKRFLMERKRKIILPQSHPLAGKDKISMSQLREEGFMMVEREETPTGFDMVVELCNCFGYYPVIVSQPADFDTLYMLIEAGKGLTVSCVPPDAFTCPRVSAVAIDESDIPEQMKEMTLRNDLFVLWRDENENPAFKRIKSKFAVDKDGGGV